MMSRAASLFRAGLCLSAAALLVGGCAAAPVGPGGASGAARLGFTARDAAAAPEQDSTPAGRAPAPAGPGFVAAPDILPAPHAPSAPEPSVPSILPVGELTDLHTPGCLMPAGRRAVGPAGPGDDGLVITSSPEERAQARGTLGCSPVLANPLTADPEWEMLGLPGFGIFRSRTSSCELEVGLEIIDPAQTASGDDSAATAAYLAAWYPHRWDEISRGLETLRLRPRAEGSGVSPADAAALAEGYSVSFALDSGDHAEQSWARAYTAKGFVLFVHGECERSGDLPVLRTAVGRFGVGTR